MINLLSILLISGFIQKGYINMGIYEGDGKILVGDFNRDGNIDLIFHRTDLVRHLLYGVILELDTLYNYEWKDTIYEWGNVWGIGDFDLDGLFDLVTKRGFGGTAVGPSVYESPDSFSYPMNEVWRDTQFVILIPLSVYDIDKDSFPEIIYPAGGTGVNYYINFTIYECIEDNNYLIKYQFESPETFNSTVAFGDFDSDGLNEFVYGTIDGQYSVFESDSNDSYVPLIVNRQLPTANIFDCFTINDADQDGKPEFVVKGFTVPDGKFEVFIFESIGDNTYEIIDTFYFSINSIFSQGYSASGDIDNDSIPEAILMTNPWIRILKAKGNNDFYVWDSIRIDSAGSIAIYDVDGNGINEIIYSGNDETKFFEWDGTGISENPLLPDPRPLFPTIAGTISLSRNYKIYNITGRLIVNPKSLLQGIYFLKADKKIFKIIKIK